MTTRRLIIYLFIFWGTLSACGDDPVATGDLTDIEYDPIAYLPAIPENFPALEQPENNMMTVDGILLGRKLFFDSILSGDSTMSCASCHLQQGNFTDNLAVSSGIDGFEGRRSSMALLNIGFDYNGLFWDGRAATLEEQALLPVEDPVEMHATWPEVVERLMNHKDYPTDFRKAFGIQNTSEINKDYAAFAIAQFERTLVSSGNSRFDRFLRGEIFLTDSEFNGYDMFFDASPDFPDAECAHCHSAPLFTSNRYFNNGLDDVPSLEDFDDSGRGEVTGVLFDNGKFRVPTLRNIEFSAPYMHDGRFETLEEVVEHYNSGGSRVANTDPLIRPLGLSESQKKDLIAFIRTLADTSFLQNPLFSSPF